MSPQAGACENKSLINEHSAASTEPRTPPLQTLSVRDDDRMQAQEGVQPCQFKDRIIFMSIKNGKQWWQTQIEEVCR